MLKVANVIEDARIAGPQLRILAVAEKLKSRGIATTVIHPIRQMEQFGARLDKADISRVPLPIQTLSRGWMPVARYLVHFPMEIILLWRLFLREQFDFVHCSGGAWQIKALIAARLANRKALWHMNDTILPLRLRPVFRFICKHFVYRLIVAGQRVREHYVGAAELCTPIIEIQAPVDCEKFDPMRTVPDARISISHGIKVVTVANLNPLKGLEYFVQMAAHLSRQFKDVVFYIVGPVFGSQNAYFSRITALIKENALTNVHFYGPSDDIPSVLRAADLYVCSSIAEASPTSVWEAMAMGKAVVSTDVGDVAKFLTNGESGFVVPTRDGEALALSAARFVRDAELRKRCGAAARRVAVEKLDLSVCVAAHLQAYS